MGADLGAQETLKTRRFKKRDAFPSLFAWERPVLSRLRVLLPGPFTRLPLRWAEGKAVRRESRWLAGRAAGRWDPALPFREAAGPGMRGRQADCEGGAGQACLQLQELGASAHGVSSLLVLICQFFFKIIKAIHAPDGNSKQRSTLQRAVVRKESLSHPRSSPPPPQSRGARLGLTFG